jgi:hypothetical protein
MGEIERNGWVLNDKFAQLKKTFAAERIERGVDNENAARGVTLLTQGSDASLQQTACMVRSDHCIVGRQRAL